MIVGFRYGMYDPSQTGTYKTYGRPRAIESYYGSDYNEGMGDYNYVTPLDLIYRTLGVYPPVVMTVAPGIPLAGLNYSFWLPFYDNNANKYKQMQYDPDTDPPLVGDTSSWALDGATSGCILQQKVVQLENLLDPMQELEVINSGSITGGANVPEPNIWAVDFEFPDLPDDDRWYGQPDVAKIGWCTAIHKSLDAPIYGKLQFINFQNTRVFFKDR